MFAAKLRAIAIVVVSFLAAPAFAQEPDLAAMVEAWTKSAHADATAEAFTHWNAEGEVPAACAVCHAGTGFRDFHGLDGTPAGAVDNKIATGSVVDCDTCHVEGAMAISEITFPSGVMLSAPAGTGMCWTCHQGRSSGASLAASLSGDWDEVNPELNFQNPHYALAAATLNGSAAKGLFEYDGQTYAGAFAHVPEVAGCTGCHNPHSLEVKVDACAECHKTSDPLAIRTTTRDFDGDGDVTEGIASEVETLRGMLAEGIARYAADKGTPIAYSPTSYPYFFVDTNGNGTADPEEANRDNAYKAWTPRLLAAAYNYQFVTKDPGAFAHNPAYVLQALHDSIMDLAAATDWQPGPIARP